MRTSVSMLFLLLLFVGPASEARAQDVTQPARLFPKSALVYFELTAPGRLVDAALDPQWREVLRQSEPAKKYFQSRPYKQLQKVVDVVESKFGKKWPEILREAAGGGVYLAINPGARQAIVAVKARDRQTLARLREMIVDLAQRDAADKGQESPIRSGDYQGVTVWSAGKQSFHAILGDLLVVSNQREGLQEAIERSQGKQAGSLADTFEFKQAEKMRGDGQLGFGVLRIGPILQTPGVASVFTRKTNNPLGELLGGGVADSLRQAPFIAIGITLTGAKLAVKAEFPHKRQQISEKRQWFFAPDTEHSAFKPLRPEGTIASVSLYRNLEDLWHARDELFDEATVANLSQADTNLGLYFSGRDFATEVLGALGPRHQFVVARRTFDDDQPTPAIKLPAFAWVLEMEDPQDFSPVLLLAYQKIVGIVNIVGGMQGQPQLLLGGEQYHDVTISKATFLVPPNTLQTNAAINYNFAPACAQVGNRFIFSSTLGLTRQLIDELQKSGAAELTADNTRIDMDLKQLAAVLDDNREALITQGILKEGRSREESANQLGVALEALRLIQAAGWRLSAANGNLSLETTIGLPGKK